MSPHGLKIFARMGYGSRGVVYLIIGGLATLAAVQGGGGATGSRGALRELLQQPFGLVLVAAMCVGLFGYAGWRATQALLDADAHGTDAKGLVVRAGLLVSAITHTALAVYALSLIVGAWSSGGGGNDMVAWLMEQSFGRYLVGAVGLCIAGAGLAQIWKGARLGFLKHMEFSRGERPVVSWICGFGLIARGIVFCLIAMLFGIAAVTVDPQQAGGTQEAMAWLREQPYGHALFAVMAVGLIAFGIYSLVEAGWRKIEMADESDNG